MEKSRLKAMFASAKTSGKKYIGVAIETEGSSKPEIIINPRENFSIKFDYYMEAYDDDLVLIAAKGKKDIRITGIAQGGCFEDIECQLIEAAGTGWKKPIAEAIDKAYERMVADTPPKDEAERLNCEHMREAIKGMFINLSRTASEARFIVNHMEEYGQLFDVCMNGDDLQFKSGIVKLQQMQNEEILREELKTDE